MAKKIFIGAGVLIFAGLGLLCATNFGLIPSPLYALGQAIPFLHPPVTPYLQKFEGTWNISLDPLDSKSDLGACTGITGTVYAHDGVFSGTIGPHGAVLAFNAAATSDGTLTGEFGGTTVHMGEIKAILDGAGGAGTWQDNYGCSGSLAMKKQSSAVDPVRGKIVSANGDTRLMRGEMELTLMPGLQLYEGDTVEVGEGDVLLRLNNQFDPMSVPAHTTYTVPR